MADRVPKKTKKKKTKTLMKRKTLGINDEEFEELANMRDIAMREGNAATQDNETTIFEEEDVNEERSNIALDPEGFWDQFALGVAKGDIQLQEWHPDVDAVRDDGTRHFTTCIFGQRGTGKTFATRDMAFAMRNDFFRMYVITGSVLDDFWTDYLPSGAIIDADQMNQALDMLWKQQVQLLKLYKKGKISLYEATTLIVLDDWVDDRRNARYNQLVDKWFVRGRHVNAIVIALSHTATGTSTYCRDNTDFVGIFKMRSVRQIEQFRQDHAGQFKMKSLRMLLEATTRDRAMLIINKSSVLEDPMDIFKIYRAQNPAEKFKGSQRLLGDPKWWMQMLHTEEDREKLVDALEEGQAAGSGFSDEFHRAMAAFSF